MSKVFLRCVLAVGLLSAALYAQDLRSSGFEVRASGGIINVGSGSVRIASPSPGFQGAFGLSRFIALTAGYTYDHMHGGDFVTCPSLPTAPNLPGQTFVPKDCSNFGFQHEFIGGVRISAPNRNAITPHIQFNLGAVKQTGNWMSEPFVTGRTEFGFGPGAGIDYKLSRHFGIGVDANFVKANRMTGFYHVTGDVFFRF
jgi:opacity protein-like surface antigen